MNPEHHEGFFHRNLDVFLGLLAWLVAASNYYSLPDTWDLSNIFMIKGVLVPSLWLFLTIRSIRLRLRPAWRLWWVWPSAPMALFVIYLAAGVFVAHS